MLTDPLLDDRRDYLHCACDINFAVGIAGRFYLLGQLGAEPMVRQTYDTGAVYRAIVVAGEAGEQRVRHCSASKEGDGHATHIVLIDQYADMSPPLERFGNLHWRVDVG